MKKKSIVIGSLVAAASVAGGVAAYKNKDKIKEKVNSIKSKKQDKKSK